MVSVSKSVSREAVELSTSEENPRPSLVSCIEFYLQRDKIEPKTIPIEQFCTYLEGYLHTLKGEYPHLREIAEDAYCAAVELQWGAQVAAVLRVNMISSSRHHGAQPEHYAD